MRETVCGWRRGHGGGGAGCPSPCAVQQRAGAHWHSTQRPHLVNCSRLREPSVEYLRRALNTARGCRPPRPVTARRASSLEVKSSASPAGPVGSAGAEGAAPRLEPAPAPGPPRAVAPPADPGDASRLLSNTVHGPEQGGRGCMGADGPGRASGGHPPTLGCRTGTKGRQGQPLPTSQRKRILHRVIGVPSLELLEGDATRAVCVRLWGP